MSKATEMQHVVVLNWSLCVYASTTKDASAKVSFKFESQASAELFSISLCHRYGVVSIGSAQCDVEEIVIQLCSYAFDGEIKLNRLCSIL